MDGHEDLAALFERMQSALSTLELPSLTELAKARAKAKEHMDVYLGEAGLQRRRAARNREERESHLGRAAWYEARAEVMRAATEARAVVQVVPVHMPAWLRTPAEQLDAVDRFRHVLAELVDLADELKPDEVSAFVQAIPHPDEIPSLNEATRAAAEALDVMLSNARGLLERLGVKDGGHFEPYRSPANATVLVNLEGAINDGAQCSSR
jgi:hypothetical protein